MSPEVHTRVPVLTSRLPASRPVWVWVWLVLLVLLTAVGVLLITDRPGLEARYFSLGAPWEGKPRYVTVGEPRLEHVSQVDDILLTRVAFSIRWKGWWEVAQSGEHQFSLDVDDGGYVRIDDEIVVDVGGAFGEPIKGGRIVLEPGFHTIEIGLYQRHSESRLAVRWVEPGAGPGEAAEPLPAADLYRGRPLELRRTLRQALSSWSRPYRQILGVVFLIAVALSLRRSAPRFERSNAWFQAQLDVLARPGPRRVLLLGFFALTFFVSVPLTGPLRGGDDTAYLLTATFNLEGWFFVRYGHIYLLKLFTALCGGDPLLGARVWWSFVFAATVAALAVAVRSVGNGLQLRTLAATLFVLLSQTIMVGFIGAPFADYSAMMFVTVAVAVYMHGLASARDRPPPRHEWHALAIGALSAGAMRSKEVGAILLLLPLLFLLVEGRLDPRRFARRLGYWMVGIGGALALLMVLDGLFLGDFFFTLGGDRLAHSRGMNFPEGVARRSAADSWMNTIWLPGLEGIDLSLRFLWLGVCGGALAAGSRQRRLELRFLHLLPIAYLLALIALYVRMPHVFSVRMLIPILPVASLMTGLLLHYVGLDDVPWKRMLSPGVLSLGGLGAALVFFVLIPYRRGALEAADFLPMSLLQRYGWAPDHFAVGVLLPTAVLTFVSVVALGAGQRRLRVTALAVAFLAVFGTGFEISRGSLVRHHAAQASDLLTFPWRAFEKELSAAPSKVVVLSQDLKGRYRMSEATEMSLAQLTLLRSDIWVGLRHEFPAEADVAIASHPVYAKWLQRQPAVLERVLAGSARWGPFGFLVLLRPKDAAEEADRLRRLEFTADEIPEFHQSLADMANNPDLEARDQLLQRILGSESIPMRRVHGDQLRAVALSAAGWTAGSRPAGLIVTNQGVSPLVQKFRLAVHAKAADYPIRVFVDDGERLRTFLFERKDRIEVELAAVSTRSSSLVIVWTDKAWSPGGDEDLNRGVRILAPSRE